MDREMMRAMADGDFAGLCGLSAHTLYQWKKRFKTQGPAGLMDQPRGGPKGSKLPELTKRTILMLKEANPDWGCERIAGMLLRGPALPASPGAVATALKAMGYVTVEEPTIMLTKEFFSPPLGASGHIYRPIGAGGEDIRRPRPGKTGGPRRRPAEPTVAALTKASGGTFPTAKRFCSARARRTTAG